MDKNEKIFRELLQKLVDKLNEATNAYNDGNPIISDAEWDEMYFTLVKLENQSGIVLPNSPTLSIYYELRDYLPKIKHEHLMLSLDKTKDIEEVRKFLGDSQWVAMAKMDGLTCSLTYEDGQLVRAETRGNGEEGEDIFHNAKANLSIPNHIPYKKRVVIDGEIICTYKEFEKWKDKFKNPRNFAAGSIRLLDSHESMTRFLTFVAWDVIEFIDNLPHSLIYQVGQLEDWGFTTVPVDWNIDFKVDTTTGESWTEANFSKTIEEAIDNIKHQAEESNYPIDGVVFKFDDLDLREKLGNTSHHFNNAIAYKFYDEEYETILRDIEWTMGRTGQLTPVAIFDPVDDGDSVITRASLHNISIMNELLYMPYVGEKIWIYKANQIIPQISKKEWIANDYNPEKNMISIPEICPICGQATIRKKENDSEVLYCANNDCAGKFINQLDHFVGLKGLNIIGLSKATLEKLIEVGWLKNRIDIFSLFLHRDAWMQLPGFGYRSVDNILASIENARKCELFQFISSLSIPLIGLSYAKEICKHEYDWHNIREDIAGGYDFTNWEGFGPEMNKSLHNYNYEEADKIANLLHLTNTLWINGETNETNLKVCITGNLHIYKNRIALTRAIENIGGKVVSSVSKNTTLLINNDVNSNSNKNLTARKLGIPIVSEETFQKNYLTT